MPHFRQHAVPRRLTCRMSHGRLMLSDTRLMPSDTRLMPLDTRLMPLDTRLMPRDTRLTPLDTRLTPLDTRLMPRFKRHETSRGPNTEPALSITVRSLSAYAAILP
jgi:hypothetical protein